MFTEIKASKVLNSLLILFFLYTLFTNYMSNEHYFFCKNLHFCNLAVKWCFLNLFKTIDNVLACNFILSPFSTFVWTFKSFKKHDTIFLIFDIILSINL